MGTDGTPAHKPWLQDVVPPQLQAEWSIGIVREANCRCEEPTLLGDEPDDAWHALANIKSGYIRSNE